MTTNEPHPPTGDSGPPNYGSTPPPSGGYPPQAPGGYSGAPQNNTKATISLILGIVGLLCCGLFAGIPALILGLIAKKEIEQSNGMQTGGGLALTGIILGSIALAWSLIYGVLLLSGAIEPFTF